MPLPTRILYWITDLTPGGTLYSVLHLIRGLDPARFEASLGGLFGGAAFRREFPSTPFRVHDLDIRKRQVLRGIRGIRGAVRLEEPHILHTFLFHANFLGRIAGRWERVPAIVTSLRVAEAEQQSHIFLDRFTHRWSDFVVCNSDGVRRCARDRARVPEEKLRVIPNAVDAALFSDARPQNEAPVLLCHGRLHRQKGFDLLLDAIHRLGPEGPARVRIAGDGPERAALGEKAVRLGLDGRFEFLGRRLDIPALLAAADLYALPSRWEGMANSLLEAMAAGRPIVAADVEGVRDLIRPGIDGLLVPPEDAGALADALRDLLRDPERAWEMGRSARARVLAEFTVDTMVGAHERLYEEVLRGLF